MNCTFITSVLVVVFCTLIGLLLTPYPKTWGWYKWHAQLYWYPMFVGLSPAHYHGEEWKFTLEQLQQQQMVNTNLKGQHALVTGANSGIGYSIAKGLTELGAASVTLACRNAVKCERAAQQIRNHHVGGGYSSNCDNTASTDVRTLIMDTSSLKSVQAGAQNYLSTMMNRNNATLDMLFLNAGTIFADQSTLCVPLSENGIEYVFATNYLGHHLLYRILEPLLRRSKPAARVVSTSSAFSFLSYSYKVATDLETLNGCSEPCRDTVVINRSYAQSKLAQIIWTKELTRRLGSDSNIYVNAFHPGMVATAIWSHTLSQAKSPQFVVDLMDRIQSDFMWTSDDGALTGLFLGAHFKYIQENQIRGLYFHPQGEPITNPDAEDPERQRALWEFSESLVADYLDSN